MPFTPQSFTSKWSKKSQLTPVFNIFSPSPFSSFKVLKVLKSQAKWKHLALVLLLARGPSWQCHLCDVTFFANSLCYQMLSLCYHSYSHSYSYYHSFLFLVILFERRPSCKRSGATNMIQHYHFHILSKDPTTLRALQIQQYRWVCLKIQASDGIILPQPVVHTVRCHAVTKHVACIVSLPRCRWTDRNGLGTRAQPGLGNQRELEGTKGNHTKLYIYIIYQNYNTVRQYIIWHITIKKICHRNDGKGLHWVKIRQSPWNGWGLLRSSKLVKMIQRIRIWFEVADICIYNTM